jgi:flavin-dependent dehydrogenase
MDELLLRRAVEVGVDVREDVTVVGVATDGDLVTGVRTRGKDNVETSISARLTIDATGRTRSVARRLATADGPKTRAQHVAFKAHIKGARTKSDASEIFAYRGGYGGCNRVEGGVYNLCFIASSDDTRRCGSDPERVLREIVFGNKRAAETLKDAKLVSEWLAVPIERFGRGELVPAPGLLTVGDAAAFIDPFTGSGILLALESAKIASSVITESFAAGLDLAEMAEAYRQKYASAFDRRLRVCAMLRYAAFVPLLADITVSALSLSTGLRRRLAHATRFDPRSNNV